MRCWILTISSVSPKHFFIQSGYLKRPFSNLHHYYIVEATNVTIPNKTLKSCRTWHLKLFSSLISYTKKGFPTHTPNWKIQTRATGSINTSNLKAFHQLKHQAPCRIHLTMAHTWWLNSCRWWPPTAIICLIYSKICFRLFTYYAPNVRSDQLMS